MILNLRFLSGENDDFILDMQIDSHATFAQLHKAIQQQLQYDASQMASFVITDYSWNREEEIALMDLTMDDDHPSTPMESAVIEDYMRDSHQRFLYVFDFFSERCLFVEILDMTDGTLAEPACIRCVGEVPTQIIIDQSLNQQEYLSDSDDDLFDEMDEFDDFDPDNDYNAESFDDDNQY